MINSKEVIEYTKEMSILFVEDHAEIRESTAEVLKNFFKKVDSAKNGIEALQIYNKYYKEHKNHYDIVLSDIQMPKLNGVSLVEEIYEINPKQSIIILSAHDDTRYLLPLINLGIEYFIKKPIDYQELLEVLLNTSKKIAESEQNPKKDSVDLGKNIIYNRKSNSLIDNGKDVYLTKYEIIFLEQLTKNIGKIYHNEEIVANYAAHNKNLDMQNIRKLVSKLRKKLPKDSLESIYGVGYKIVPKD
jgi:DNA-binding response OmpR family regulator